MGFSTTWVKVLDINHPVNIASPLWPRPPTTLYPRYRGLVVTQSTLAEHHLSIVALTRADSTGPDLEACLDNRRFMVKCFQKPTEFLDFVDENRHQIDCLVLSEQPELANVVSELRQRRILLPAAIWLDQPGLVASHTQTIEAKLEPSTPKTNTKDSASSKNPNQPWLYHQAEVTFTHGEVNPGDMLYCDIYVERAIANFLQLDREGKLETIVDLIPEDSLPISNESALLLQQSRLTEKLRARLGYLGLYYKREAKYFLRHLPAKEQQKLIQELKQEYREIVLLYFCNDDSINAKIDAFVDRAFFADISVAQIVENHMELMDEFAKQLKLEGRSRDILLDYRLTLIDTIAHLCEMYRRSIPRSD